MNASASAPLLHWSTADPSRDLDAAMHVIEAIGLVGSARADDQSLGRSDDIRLEHVGDVKSRQARRTS
jgi:hypothetical protein